MIPSNRRGDGYPHGHPGRQDLPRGNAWTAKRPLSTCPDSARCCRCRAWARRCFPSPLRRQTEDYMEFSIKKCGCVTEWLHSDGGRPADHDPRALRQRHSRWIPSLQGKDLLFIAGGIGLAPLRSVINYCRAQPRPTTASMRHRVRFPFASRISWTIKEIIDEWMNGCRHRTST